MTVNRYQQQVSKPLGASVAHLRESDVLKYVTVNYLLNMYFAIGKKNKTGLARFLLTYNHSVANNLPSINWISSACFGLLFYL